MSMNKFMHPRNIYKAKPNFKQLAIDYPEFRSFVTSDITGKVTLDFTNPEALRALSITLLKKDFNLIVEIPLNKLIPTIPLRLNYILFIEDLLKLMTCSTGTTLPYDQIRGLDIGTGASCVYPLLAARKNQWKMLATEIDDVSFQIAQENVNRNNLQDLIQLKHGTDDSLIEDAVGDEQFHFCMCNPPFFASTQELHPFFKARKSNRPHPKNAFCSSVNEVVTKGGEVEFLTRLIKESQRIGKNVIFYTAMVGCKSHLPALKKALREEAQVSRFKEVEFCQGNTTRWGFAWTFHEYDLRDFDMRRVKAKTSIKCPVANDDIVLVTNRMMKVFKELKMTCEEVTRIKNKFRYFVTASSDTWSHQRRKRREQLKHSDHSSSEMDSSVEEMQVEANPKRHADEDECEGSNLLKKLRITADDHDVGTVFFKFMFAIICVENKLFIEMDCDEATDRDKLNQILQYIKNNCKDLL